MRSIATITTPPERTALTTVGRVKSELDIEGEASDELLAVKIAEASSDIEAHIARILCSAGLTETFWGGSGCAEYLILARAPVTAVASVTVDDVAVDSSEVRLDADAGLLYRLDSSGYPCAWTWCKSVVIVFTAGFELPGADNPTLPASLESAAVDLVSSFWQSRGRDPLVKSEDIPGLGSVEYWVGSVGEAGELPPGVAAKISPYRRTSA